MEKIQANFNNFVRIKITEFGIAIMKEKHETNRANHPDDYGEFKLKVDEEGYTEMQLWKAMQIFGEYMAMGGPEPIEMQFEIIPIT